MPTSHAHECTMELGTLSLYTWVDTVEAENLGFSASLAGKGSPSCSIWGIQPSLAGRCFNTLT